MWSIRNAECLLDDVLCCDQRSMGALARSVDQVGWCGYSLVLPYAHRWESCFMYLGV